MSEAAITVRDVRYTYPDGSVALDNVNLEVMKDEKVAILGPNGAGKSTLLMHMAGVLTPQQGEVTILGMPVNEKNVHQIRGKVGMTFQNPDDQLFCSTVYEDVAYGPLNLGLPRDEVVSRTREALRQVGIEGYDDRPPHRLSEGEKKKVAIATVLSMQPKIMIIDEPSANLDPKSRQELIDLIKDLQEKQSFTLVVATHDVNLVPQVADRTFILNQGRVIAEGPAREVFLDLEVLHRARLEPPSVTRLFNLLTERNAVALERMPLTIDEALREVQRLIRNQGSSRRSSISKKRSARSK